MRRRRVLVLVCLVGVAGCLDRVGLDESATVDAGSDASGGGGGQLGGRGGTGGSGGTGAGGAGGGNGGTGAGGAMGGNGGTGAGGGGAGGQQGGTGGKPDAGADVPPTCGPVCAIFCPNGNVVDSKGCPTCQCKPAPTCRPVTCRLFCQHGFKKDVQGCEICACNEAPAGSCDPKECGPAPGAPNFTCADGTVGGPSCERTQTGRCAWIFRDCPDGCGNARSPTACVALPACRWLEPGCGEPKLAVAGCYPKAFIDCEQKACPDGRQCLSRVINPCASPSAGAGAPALVPPPGGCAACGQQISICL